MADRIVGLVPATQPVDPVLVELIEGLLADAKAGRLAYLVGVCAIHDGTAYELVGGTMNEFEVVGRLVDLQAAILAGDDE